MKKTAVFLCALCLALVLAPSASASQNGGGLIGIGGTGGSSGSQSNLNEMFAQMQSEMATTAKNAAMEGLGEIQELQAQQKQTEQYLRRAQDLQVQAEQAQRAGQTPPAVPQDMRRYLEENGVSVTDIPSAVRGLQTLRDRQGVEIQRQMARVQDFLGQYNASTANALSYGQSLFSTSGAVSAEVSPIVASLLAGVLLGMAAMWGIQRRGRKGGAQ